MKTLTDLREATPTDIRSAILDATERILARDGYEKMSMDGLARGAGVTRSVIYAHFATKEDVALTTIDRIVERVMMRLRALARSDMDTGDRIREMLVARVMMRFDCVAGYATGLCEMLASIRPAYLARRDLYFEAEAEVLADVLFEGHRSGGLNVEAPLTTARTLIDATNSMLPFALSPAELGERREVEAKTRAIADLVVAGLRNASPTVLA